MNAMPMIEVCAERQRRERWDDFRLVLDRPRPVIRCVCGSELVTTHTQCATCALRVEVRLLPEVRR